MREESTTSELEIFLIRTLTTKERKFSPRNMGLVMCPIANFKWAPGDILVRRSKSVRNGFECAIVPMSELTVRRGTTFEPQFRYNRVTVQRDYASLDNVAGTVQAPSLVGARFTYQLDIKGGRPLEVVIQNDLPSENLDWYRDVASTLLPGLECRIINNNKAEIISVSGVHAFVVLSHGRNVQVKSFCPRDIIWGLGKTSGTAEYGPSFSFARPLTYFWTNEAFDFRLVADEVSENQSSQSPESEMIIDNALRYLVSRMLETRQAISDLIVDLILDVAAELTHSTLDRLRSFRLQIKELQMMLKLPKLQPILLQKLVEFDLKRVLPVFESDFSIIFSSLAPDFDSRVQQRIASMVPMVGVIYRGSCCLQELNQAAQYMLLKVHHLIYRNTDQEFGSASNQVRLTEMNTSPEVDGYQAVLFHGLQTSAASGEFEATKEVAKLRAILSKADGFIFRKQQLVCWERKPAPPIEDPVIPEDPEGPEDPEDLDLVDYHEGRTNLAFIDLGKIEQLCHSPTAEVPEDEWLKYYDLEMEIDDPRAVCLESGTLHLFKIKGDKDGLNPYLISINPSPRMEHQQVRLSDEIAAYRRYWKNPKAFANHQQHCVSYSTEFGLLFLANISHGELVGGIDPCFLEIFLSASALHLSGDKSLVALTNFKGTNLPRELSIPWEFQARNAWRQGVTPNTFNLPYSPLRWCTTRLNVYCLWLLSPHSRFIFGFQKDRFVQLSYKLSYRSLSLELPYMLPAFTMDRVCGMPGLFQARRWWSVRENCWIVTVYKLRLRAD